MADIKVKLRPLMTPNYAIQEMPAGLKQDGLRELPKFALSELDAETLSDLCDEFRREIFTKAGKSDPSCPVKDSTGEKR